MTTPQLHAVRVALNNFVQQNKALHDACYLEGWEKLDNGKLA